MRKTILAAGLAIATAAVTMTSCGNSNNSKSIADAEYDGDTFFRPTLADTSADTVFDFGKTQVATKHISRYMSLPDSNFFISINIYASENNETINGTLSKYINEAINMFSYDGPDVTIGIDTAVTLPASGMTAVADSAVSYFETSVIPNAQADSIPGLNLAIELKPVWANESYITYEMASQSYLGGAHGEDDFYLQTFDSKTGAMMGFYNLVPADKQDKVREKLLSTISRANDMSVEQYLAMVNQWIGNDKSESWTVTSFPIYHVALTDQGYVFCYPKYSIAPGVAGCPVYVVPED